MARRLVAVVVLLLLGCTPSLALACDARCLDQPSDSAGTTPAVHAHGGHAHHQPGVGQPSDAASPAAVTVFVTAASTYHGCPAALDAGTLDRQPVSPGTGQAAEAALVPPTPPVVPACRQVRQASPGSRPGRAAIPLRI